MMNRQIMATIQAMLENPMDTTHFDTVKKLYCWEQEEKILLEAINRLFKQISAKKQGVL